tara:strand:+ start:429 stop:605 length:177 start_codon:yes stop_codon:yes gene_type:complete
MKLKKIIMLENNNIEIEIIDSSITLKINELPLINSLNEFINTNLKFSYKEKRKRIEKI